MIQQLPYKTKQFFFVLIKISIVVIAFYFIYKKLTQNNDLDFNTFNQIITKKRVLSLKTISFLLVLSIFNWFFEILKWQALVSPIKHISFKNALEQTFGSLTASLVTPNRIGEYGAKAMYYTKNFRKQIMLTNLIHNTLQMGVTTGFGLVGCLYFLRYYDANINFGNGIKITFLILLLIGVLVAVLRRKKVSFKGFSFEKLATNLKQFPKKVIGLALCYSLARYLIFSFQFYYLLLIFDVELTYLDAMTLITTMYFLASIIPSIFVLDVLVKGSVAVYLFSFVGAATLTILSIVTLMWLFNFVLPSIYGSYFVLKFKLPKHDFS